MYKILSRSAVIVLMLLIFFLSNQPATSSNDLSEGITSHIKDSIEWFVPNIHFDVESLNHFVRKCAHFFFYFLLGVAMCIVFRIGKNQSIKRLAIAFFICVLYAITDEIHQLFVPGRGGQVTDVLIDSAGAMTGICSYILMQRIWSKKKAI